MIAAPMIGIASEGVMPNIKPEPPASMLAADVAPGLQR